MAKKRLLGRAVSADTPGAVFDSRGVLLGMRSVERVVVSGIDMTLLGPMEPYSFRGVCVGQPPLRGWGWVGPSTCSSTAFATREEAFRSAAAFARRLVEREG